MLVLIVSDILLRTVTLVLLVIYWKELLFGSTLNIRQSFTEYYELVSTGVKLLLANLLSMLIFGIGRFIVQFNSSIETFAIFSFGIVLVNFMMIAITATSTVIYPHLASNSLEKLDKKFAKIDAFLLYTPLFYLAYFPVCYFVYRFYPNYSELMDYFAIFLAYVVITARMSVLNNTYFKLLRLEAQMLKVNMVAVIIFVLSYGFLFLVGADSEIYVAISTLIALWYRAYYAHRLIIKSLDVSYRNVWIVADVLLNVLIVTLFTAKYYLFAILFILTTSGFRLLIKRGKIGISL